MSEHTARLRGQIYEAEYSMRFIVHDGYCRAALGPENQCGRLYGAGRGFCARWKQLGRIDRLKAALADVVAMERTKK